MAGAGLEAAVVAAGVEVAAVIAAGMEIAAVVAAGLETALRGSFNGFNGIKNVVDALVEVGFRGESASGN
jgi:hypothetical protein